MMSMPASVPFPENLLPEGGNGSRVSVARENILQLQTVVDETSELAGSVISETEMVNDPEVGRIEEEIEDMERVLKGIALPSSENIEGHDKGTLEAWNFHIALESIDSLFMGEDSQRIKEIIEKMMEKGVEDKDIVFHFMMEEGMNGSVANFPKVFRAKDQWEKFIASLGQNKDALHALVDIRRKATEIFKQLKSKKLLDSPLEGRVSVLKRTIITLLPYFAQMAEAQGIDVKATFGW